MAAVLVDRRATALAEAEVVQEAGLVTRLFMLAVLAQQGKETMAVRAQAKVVEVVEVQVLLVTMAINITRAMAE